MNRLLYLITHVIFTVKSITQSRRFFIYYSQKAKQKIAFIYVGATLARLAPFNLKSQNYVCVRIVCSSLLEYL
jgi:hypothetical protein